MHIRAADIGAIIFVGCVVVCNNCLFAKSESVVTPKAARNKQNSRYVVENHPGIFKHFRNHRVWTEKEISLNNRISESADNLVEITRIPYKLTESLNAPNLQLE